jgi:Domain of unknown function (DUF929)
VPDSDSEGPDIVEIAPDILDRTPAFLKAGVRRPVIIAAAAVLAVAVAIASFVVLRPTSSPGPNPALAKLVTQVTTVPVAAMSSGDIALSPADSTPVTFGSVSGAPLTKDGKPEIFYVAAEYCPYCDAQNWALIVALSFFGTFSGLNTVRTHPYDGIAPVDGWTFYGSSYTSNYLAFVPVERYSAVLVNPKANPGDGTSYRKLQHLTPAQQAIFNRYDQTHAVPFIDFANQTVTIGSSVVPELFAGKTWSQVAGSLRGAHTRAAKAILGAAISFTAQICQLTGGRPTAVCAALSALPQGN